MTINYSELSDSEIISLVRNKDDDAMDYLIKKYSYLAKREERFFFLVGGDSEDIYQEGMIGLFKAIRDYEEGPGASFVTFATLCVRRQIQKAVTASNRGKNSPLRDYVSIEDKENVDSDMPHEKSPLDLYLENERFQLLLSRIIECLTVREKKVFDLYIQNYSYDNIAEKLGVQKKSVDNAITRIKAKARQKFSET